MHAQHTSVSSSIAPGALTRRRKAAMIVQMLFRDGEGIPLTRMPPKLQEALAHELGAIRLIDKDTVAAVAEEFAEELNAVGLVAPGNTLQALDELGDKIDADLSQRLRAEITAAQNGDPWPLIANLSEDDLVAALNAQSVQVGGVILSKLSVQKAAAVLAKIDGLRARTITFGMSQTAEISPAAVLRIGKALVKDHCTQSTVAFDAGPDSRLGAILNTSPAATRDDVLSGLTDEDPDFADEVRRKIFTFADIATRIKPTDIPLCIRNIDADELNTAMASALAGEDAELASAEYILANMSQRMATQIRETATEIGKVSTKAAETAKNAVTTVIRQMEADDAISYMEGEDEEDD